MQIKGQKENAITLIALVITIAILLILAGVTISQITGEKGLFSAAKKAKEDTINAQEQEEKEIEKLLGLLNNNGTGTGDEEGDKTEELPENTKDTEAGTIVKVSDEWTTETARYVSTQTGTEVVSQTKVATVYAVSVGDGQTVPVPYGFYYVGGNKESGVVISDSQADINKYAGQTDVGTNLEGNQFVFIPCSTSEYKKTNWGQGDVANISDCYWDTTEKAAELVQIQKYNGFYVARYEAGLDTSKAHTEEIEWYSNLYNNETARPQSKSGLVPWGWTSWNTAKARAEEMYDTNYVMSGLITGTQWDVMINKIAEKTEASLTESDWGNYYDTSVTYTGPVAIHDRSTIKLGTYSGNGGVTTKNQTDSTMLIYTGTSEECKKYNLYDVAGNLWEWTEETSYSGGNTETEYRVLRSGGCNESNYVHPVCYRRGANVNAYFYADVGFRVVLYMK